VNDKTAVSPSNPLNVTVTDAFLENIAKPSERHRINAAAPIKTLNGFFTDSKQMPDLNRFQERQTGLRDAA